jgi:hypothetical protein
MICKREIPNMDIYKALVVATRRRTLDNHKEIKELKRLIMDLDHSSME